MSRLSRLARNLFGGWGLVGKFPRDAFARIDTAIAASERRHGGEIVFAVETRLWPGAVLAGIDAHKRARSLFSRYRIWDTEQNVGVLIYALLAEHRVEIVADRGVMKRVTQAELDAICATVVDGFRRGEPEHGVVTAIEALTALLAPHFPDQPGAPTELCDAPIVV